MTSKVANRNALKSSEWLLNAVVVPWTQLQPPSVGELKVQQFDLSGHVNMSLANQRIRDAFERVVMRLGGSASREDRVVSDGEMAVAIHKALNGITRREASDADFWAYVTCFGCPRYVRWRWETPILGALWTRFAGNIRRNAVSRLWWWAEITFDASKSLDDPNRYALTKNVKGRQSLMLWFVDCAFSGNHLVAHQLANLQEVKALNDNAQKAVCRTMNRLARVVCLDSVSNAAASDKLCQKAYTVSQLLT